MRPDVALKANPVGSDGEMDQLDAGPPELDGTKADIAVPVVRATADVA